MSNVASRPPPGAWTPARGALLRVMRPIESFLHIEAASGILLLVAALVALGWANSPWHASYAALWHTPFGLTLGAWSFQRDLHFWVNDGLMTIFFFVVGMEIRREIYQGELSEFRRALLPIFAAAGGMIAPALIYASLNHGGPAARGWGVPTATDIAFAVGVLALLGKRVPAALRVMLLALAIIDDIGAIIVIAVFYTAGVNLAGLGIACAGLLAILLLQRFGIRRAMAYLPPALIAWWGMLESGVHPTIAGVAIGLMTPVHAWFGEDGFVEEVREKFSALETKLQEPHGASDLLGPLTSLSVARREAVSPVENLIHAFHPWVAFGIMPIFALANAGVVLAGASLADHGGTAALGIALGLIVGKPVGIVAFSVLSAKLGITKLPAGVGLKGLLVVGLVAGIGFTMAIFVADLAFDDPALLGTAKLFVLVGSFVSAILGLAWGRAVLKEEDSTRSAQTASEAEQSTEL